MDNFIIQKNQADAKAIKNHFQSCDSSFIKELSDRVNLDEYIEKILTKAVRYEVWEQDKLIGFLAVYEGDEFTFITNISVSEAYAKRGIASFLLNYLIELNTNHDIRLEVLKNNQAANTLYTKFCFKKISEAGASQILGREISPLVN